jgi:hypothetical protein
LFLFSAQICSQTITQDEDNCIGNACYPSTGDLLVGRGEKLFASSTCGTNGRAERFCVISNLKRRDCDWCDSRPIAGDQRSHLPKFMEILYDGRKKSWWQSENGKENVYLQVLYLYHSQLNRKL